MTALLHRLGFVYEKPKRVPGKGHAPRRRRADAEAQRADTEGEARREAERRALEVEQALARLQAQLADQ